MELMAVEGSSNITHVGYDNVSSTLFVRFKNSEVVYSFAGVPAEKHGEMMADESKGSYFAKNIRGKYESNKHNPTTE